MKPAKTWHWWVVGAILWAAVAALAADAVLNDRPRGGPDYWNGDNYRPTD